MKAMIAALAALGIVVSVGCSSPSTSPPPGPPPVVYKLKVDYFTATPTSLATWDSSRIAFKVSGYQSNSTLDLTLSQDGVNIVMIVQGVFRFSDGAQIIDDPPSVVYSTLRRIVHAGTTPFVLTTSSANGAATQTINVIAQ